MLTDKEAIEVANKELYRAVYLSECGRNEGIKAIYSDKAEWLSIVIHLARKGMRKEDKEK